MNELLGVDAFLRALLSGDAQLVALATGGIYSDNAPEGAVFPHVIYGEHGNSDQTAPGPVRVLTEAVYLVKVVGQCETYVSLGPINARIDALLQGAHGTQIAIADAGVEQTVILGCYRESTIRMPETHNGVEYRHLGGLYRFFAR